MWGELIEGQRTANQLECENMNQQHMGCPSPIDERRFKDAAASSSLQKQTEFSKTYVARAGTG